MKTRSGSLRGEGDLPIQKGAKTAKVHDLTVPPSMLLRAGETIKCPRQCPLLGVKRTWGVALQMSAFDPKRTSVERLTTYFCAHPGAFPTAASSRYDALSLRLGKGNETAR